MDAETVWGRGLKFSLDSMCSYFTFDLFIKFPVQTHPAIFFSPLASACVRAWLTCRSGIHSTSRTADCLHGQIPSLQAITAQAHEVQTTHFPTCSEVLEKVWAVSRWTKQNEVIVRFQTLSSVTKFQLPAWYKILILKAKTENRTQY